MCTPLNSPMENLFFHQFFTNSINNFISNFLFSRALFLFICTYSHLWKLMRICENLFFPVRFFESVFFSAKTYFLKSLWKSASYEHHHLRCIFYYHCWLHMFQFYGFYFEFFSFCFLLFFCWTKCFCIYGSLLQYLLVLQHYIIFHHPKE